MASSSHPLQPDVAKCASWLVTWTQPSGAIYGFHNHPVWGMNPFRSGDYTSGHTTFASLTMPALAQAWIDQPNEEAWKLLLKMIDFQSGSFQANGFYDHIGFQFGEILKVGLIHNVVPSVSLCETARLLKKELPAEALDKIDRAVRKNLKACAAYGDQAMPGSCLNQEFTRQWAKLLHMEVYGHAEWDQAVQRDLDYMIAEAGIADVPGPGCLAFLRQATDKTYLEPAEYYGLMIKPLLMANVRYGAAKYLDAARAVARHVIRSSWVDDAGQTRFHRDWTYIDSEWQRLREPMLIGGMGLTIRGILDLYQQTKDEECREFLEKIDATYLHYQTPFGYFVAATGWNAEQDLIPSTAWQSHDLWYLTERIRAQGDFWEKVFAPETKTAVLLGPSFIWIESGPRWALRGYKAMDGFELIGRKDQSVFYHDMPDWVEGGRKAPADFHIPNCPVFIKTEEQAYQIAGDRCLVHNISKLRFKDGPG